jgi:hypothetical protein
MPDVWAIVVTASITAFISAAFGAFFGGLANLALKKIELRAAELTARIDEACKELDELERLGEEYWKGDGNEGEYALMARRIVSQYDVINKLILLCSENNDTYNDAEIRSRMNKVYDQVTGGDFQVKDRRRDIDRIHGMMRDVADLKLQLRRTRRYRFP